jgi:hypothetical protein
MYITLTLTHTYHKLVYKKKKNEKRRRENSKVKESTTTSVTMLPQAIALLLFTNSCHTHRWRSLHSTTRIKAKDFREEKREAFP